MSKLTEDSQLASVTSFLEHTTKAMADLSAIGHDLPDSRPAPLVGSRSTFTRELALAKTKIQEAQMWMQQHLVEHGGKS